MTVQNKHDDTKSKIMGDKYKSLCRIMLSNKFLISQSFTPTMASIYRKSSRHLPSDFQYVFAHSVMKGNALEALSIFLLSQAKSDAIFLLI